MDQRLTAKATLLLSFLAITFYANCQTDSASGVGSDKFKTNGSRKFWMGANYRKEWKTPIKAPVLNMATEKGGLKPVRLGGGKQSKSLRLEDPTGKQYALRLIEKFITAKTLPADLQSQAAEDLVADGVSASYPYSALSVPPLAEAAGVPYNKSKLVYVPDDPLLGEFKDAFKNRLALLEERLPESVSKGYDSYEVAMKLKEDNDDDVDQQAVLRARILDMYIMDFDRHEDQWQWGAIDKDKGKTYYPVPRDRDQAFFINQGVVPGMVGMPWVAPQLQGFRGKAKNMYRFNFAARNFDRFFLTELSEQDWKKAVDEFIPKMTDEVIQKAIDQQPKEIRSISGDKIVNILKERRKYLEGEVMNYYRHLSETVSVAGSDKKELFNITRNDDGSVLLQVYKITKEGEQSTKMYERLFDPAVTKEIRLYSLGGDDKFTLKGNTDKIKIRMIGGDGKDLFENTGDARSGSIVYDRKDGDNKLIGDLRNKMANDTIVNSFNRLDFKYNQAIPFLSVGYNSDDGVSLGFSLKFINHGFRKEPYKNSHEFLVNHSLATKAYEFRYYAEYIGVFGKNTDLLTYLNIKAPNNVTNFFGYGDNSIYDKTKPEGFKYYRARYTTGDVAVLLRKRFSEKVMFTFGPAYQYYSMDSADNVGKNILTKPFGVTDNSFTNQAYLGGRYALTVDTRDNKILPLHGVIFRMSARHLSGLNDNSYNFVQFNGDFTFHLSLAPRTLVLVNRTGGGHNFNNFEFYQAQYLGSEDNLRGYRKNRFAGRSKFYNNTELRWRVATFRTYLFPAFFGLLAFYDTGKVWADGESNKWLSGYGAGIWVAPLRRIVITFSYTASKEDKIPLVGFGWKF